VRMRNRRWAEQREIATAKRGFPLPQEIEMVHQDVASSCDGSGSEDRDYQRTSGSVKGRRLSRDERMISLEPLGDCGSGHKSDI
jgi:hypothetical protein